MPHRRAISLTLQTTDAAAATVMAEALALPVDEFLSGVVAAWLAKPKNYRRFAKRLLGDDEGDTRRKHVEKVVRSLKRGLHGKSANRGTKAKPSTKTKRKPSAAVATKPVDQELRLTARH